MKTITPLLVLLLLVITGCGTHAGSDAEDSLGAIRQAVKPDAAGQAGAGAGTSAGAGGAAADAGGHAGAGGGPPGDAGGVGKCANVTCVPLDQCHVAGTCNLATGLCSNPLKADGTACNDANGCTQTDRCQSGTCVGSNPVVCAASDQCHLAGTCDPASGACSNPLRADGTTCNDSNACTQTDTCQAGTCVGANPVVCSATVPSMPVKRFAHSAVRGPDGRIYLIGGNTGAGFVAEVDAYDPGTNTWTAVAPIPTPRYGAGAARGPDGRIYVMGGDSGTGPLATIEAYDSFTNQWSTLPPMPTRRSALGAATGSDGRIYAIGGVDYPPLSFLNVVEAYDVVTNQWSAVTPMTTPRSDVGVVADAAGIVYAIGGARSNCDSVASVEAYDAATNAWTPRAPLPTTALVHSVALGADGRIYTFGGQLGSACQNGEQANTFIYDPGHDAWSMGTFMPISASYTAAAAGRNGLISVFGGRHYPETIATVQIYDPVRNTFEVSGEIVSQCQTAGVCDRANGVCSSAIAPDGTSCYGGSCIGGSCQCAPESDAAFCSRLGKNCGSVSGTDNCSASRTVSSCGSCASAETCGGGGTPNVCGSSGGSGGSTMLTVVSASPTAGLAICKADFSPPQCTAVPFETSQDMAFQGNGFARPAVARDNIGCCTSIHRPEFANDGYYGNGASWISDSSSSWMKVDLGRLVSIDRLTFGRDRTGSYDDRDPGQFTIAVAESDDVYANGNDGNDASEYSIVFDSAPAGFSGISGPQTLQVSFGAPVVARFVKLTVANIGTDIDELEVFGSPMASNDVP